MVNTFVNFPADQKGKKEEEEKKSTNHSNYVNNLFFFSWCVWVRDMLKRLRNHTPAAGQLVDQESHHGGFLSGGVGLKAFGL